MILDGWVTIIRTGKRSYRVVFFINSAVGSLIVGIYVEEIYEEEDWCFWKAFQNSSQQVNISAWKQYFKSSVYDSGIN